LRRYPIQRGSPQRGRKVGGVKKNCDFRLKLQSFSETVRDGTTVTMERWCGEYRTNGGANGYGFADFK